MFKTVFGKFAALGFGIVLAASAGVAQARGDVSWSIGIASPGVVVGDGYSGYRSPPRAYYSQPAPVYYAPSPPVYYAPSPPEYYAPPRPVYYAPPPVVYAPPPYYYGGRVDYYEDRGRGRGHRHGHHGDGHRGYGR